MPNHDENEEEIVRRTAALARLSIDAAEERALAHDFARILASFRTLEEVDLADGAPEAAADATDVQGPARRADVPTPFPDAALLLAAAPDREADPDDARGDEEGDGGSGFFGVPKTLGGAE